jgi:hypothetical protein
MTDISATDPVPCVSCGGPLGDSFDDQPDWATGPLCGECYQANQTAEDELHEDLYGDGEG